MKKCGASQKQRSCLSREPFGYHSLRRRSNGVTPARCETRMPPSRGTALAALACSAAARWHDAGMSNNVVCWVDIPVADLPRAIEFYTAVLGAPVERQIEHGFDFGLLPHTRGSVSGCLIQSPENRPSMTGPLVYLSVEGRLDEALRQVEPAGGLVLAPKEQIGPYGFRAIIRDTEGNRVALHSTA